MATRGGLDVLLIVGAEQIPLLLLLVPVPAGAPRRHDVERVILAAVPLVGALLVSAAAASTAAAVAGGPVGGGRGRGGGRFKAGLYLSRKEKHES